MANPSTGQNDPLYTPPTVTPPAIGGQPLTGGLLSAPDRVTPTAATTTQWDVTPDQTVQGQIKKIIADDSPLIQQATATGLGTANNRGLLNSSMAIGAAQNEVYRAATPIATSDAATYGSSAKFNAGEQNLTSQFNTNQSNAFALDTQKQKDTVTNKNLDADIASTVATQAQKDTLARDAQTQINTLINKGVDADYAAKAVKLAQDNTTLINAQAGAKGLWEKYMESIDRINGQNLDEVNKQSALDNAYAAVWQGLQIYKDVEGVGIAQYLVPIVFDEDGDGKIDPPAVPVPPGTPATPNAGGSIGDVDAAMKKRAALPPSQRYMAENPDVANPSNWVSRSAAAHWNIHGKNEGRTWYGEFDEEGNAVDR